MTRTNRLFQLMQALRNHHPPVTAALLAAETGVSERTLYRDIDALRGLGAVIDGTAGYGYALTEDPALPPMMFNDEEIEALVLGLRDVQAIADPALATAAATALTKLHARLPSAQAHRLKHAVLAVNRIFPPPKPGIDVAVLRRATWDERSVSFGYVDGKGAQTSRTIDPLGIVFLQDKHCVLGWCHLRSDSRVFRLDRMCDLVVTEHSFRPRRVPMLQAALAKIKADVAEKKSSGTTLA
ncbi:putative DNA-binding transcriptional regulator YafY [Loktanella ponticola]|uniref:Putative DNA-binding transcriptional regulator YafY n=1 Tax=Yoonia ponticola TaxID=1524255 RepID=A0A7W9BHF0_9RHOB|nr:YafY family protein [Yoonia ponticola]MBB5720613.1 putative DNA-binding transcriptional regulator YafY [Yoonia ponticola]